MPSRRRRRTEEEYQLVIAARHRADVYASIMREQAERARDALNRIRALIAPADLTPPWLDEAERVAYAALTHMRLHSAEIEADVDLRVRTEEIRAERARASTRARWRPAGSERPAAEDLSSDDPTES